MSKLDDMAERAFPNFAYMEEAANGRQEARREGFASGFLAAVEMLRGKEAERKCMENTIGTGNFVSHDDWADWLLKEVGENVLIHKWNPIPHTPDHLCGDRKYCLGGDHKIQWNLVTCKSCLAKKGKK